jgi:hypothetical protein
LRFMSTSSEIQMHTKHEKFATTLSLTNWWGHVTSIQVSCTHIIFWIWSLGYSVNTCNGSVMRAPTQTPAK